MRAVPTLFDLQQRMGKLADATSNSLQQPATREDLLEVLRTSAERIRNIMSDFGPDLETLPGEFGDEHGDENADDADGDGYVNDLAIYLRAWEETRDDLRAMDERDADDHVLSAFQRGRYATIARRQIESHDYDQRSQDDFADACKEYLEDCAAELAGEYQGDVPGYEAAIKECEEIFEFEWNDTADEADAA